MGSFTGEGCKMDPCPLEVDLFTLIVEEVLPFLSAPGSVGGAGGCPCQWFLLILPSFWPPVCSRAHRECQV